MRFTRLYRFCTDATVKNCLRPLYVLNADLGEPDVTDFALLLRALEKTELIVFGHRWIDPV